MSLPPDSRPDESPSPWASPRPAQEHDLVNRLFGPVAILLTAAGALASAAGLALAIGGDRFWATALGIGLCLMADGAALWRFLRKDLRELALLLLVAPLTYAARLAGAALFVGIPGLFVPGAAHLTWLAVDVAAAAVLAVYVAYWRWWVRRQDR